MVFFKSARRAKGATDKIKIRKKVIFVELIMQVGSRKRELNESKYEKRHKNGESTRAAH